MDKSLFFDGYELFHKFKLSSGSGIIYADYTSRMFSDYNAIKFTSEALLLIRSIYYHDDDWIEVDFAEFYPWDRVMSINKNIEETITEGLDSIEIKKWLSSLNFKKINYPFLYTRPGQLTCIFEGKPKSQRSKGGKKRLEEEISKFEPFIRRGFPKPDPDIVEIKIDIFSSNPDTLPDVDRLSISIMDAFEGIVYLNDKQVRHLQPRVFESKLMYKKIEWNGNPMPHAEIISIPAGSLYPLATSVLDYYVVRIMTYYRSENEKR